MTFDEVIARLKQEADPATKGGMTRFAIKADKAFGVKVPVLRKMGKEIGTDHELAMKLWEYQNRETRILAGLVANPDRFTEEDAEAWVVEFDDWEIVDQSCFNLLSKTDYAYKKCFEWSKRPEEFVKRAGFALMARLAWQNKTMRDEEFEVMYPAIKQEATDNRNFVKKAVNWALRQIGKRNATLNASAIELAKEIAEIDSKSARWIASDALRELKSKAVRERLEIINRD